MRRSTHSFQRCRSKRGEKRRLPKDIDRLRVRRFFDHVRLDMIEIILVDINGIVLSDGVLHRLEMNKARRHWVSIETHLSERDDRLGVTFFFLCFLSKTSCLIRFERIDILRPSTFQMIHSSMFSGKSNGVHLNSCRPIATTSEEILTQCSDISRTF